MTSGSTGRPKLVGLPERALMSRWWPKLPNPADSAAFLQWSPFDHVMGLGLAAPNLPRKVHLDAGRFAANPLSWLDVVEKTETTNATMTNFGMSLLVDALRASPDRSWRLHSLRKIGVGAEQISPTLCAEFYDRLVPFGMPGDAIILGYGLSECGPVAGGTIPFSRELAGTTDGPVALDQPTPGHALRIVGDDGAILEEGDTGGIEVRGPSMTTGYLGDKEQPAFTSDGWLRTGDLGLVRNGMLTVIGRAKEVIIFNGKKIACQEIEAAITSRSRFKRVYAAPLPDEELSRHGRGKPVAIFVDGEEEAGLQLGAGAAEIRAIVGSVFRFAPAVVGLIHGSDVPRTALGKVQRHSLAALVKDPDRRSQLNFLADHTSGAEAKRAVGIEATISQVWERLLRIEGPIPRDAQFYPLGGDSVLALQMAFELEERFGLRIPLEEFPPTATLGDFVDFITKHGGKTLVTPADNTVLPRWVDDRMAEFLIKWPGRAVRESGFLRRVGAAAEGMPVFWCTQSAQEAELLGQGLGVRRPVFAMRSGDRFLDYNSDVAKAFAARYADEIVDVHPDGPYILAGNCQGCIVALDVARTLEERGHKVQLFVAVDTSFTALFDGHRIDVPTALVVASHSKFNPYRTFRDPGAGLAKLFPAGHRMSIVTASYPHVIRQAGEDLVQVVDDAIRWSAGPTSTAAERTWHPESVYAGQMSGWNEPMTMYAGERRRVTVGVKNGGSLQWLPYADSGIALANHWLSQNGEVRVWFDGHVPLVEPVASGQTLSMQIDIVAPRQPGSYVVEVDMVEEGVRWFSERFLMPLHIPVHVVSGMAGVTRRVRSALARFKHPTTQRS